MKPSSNLLHKAIVYTMLLLFTSTTAQAQFYNSVEGNGVIELGPRDSLGNFYYLSDNMIVKVNGSNQNVLWQKQLNVRFPSAIHLTDSDSSNNLIVTTFEKDIFTMTTIVRAISPAGVLLWTKEMSSDPQVYAPAFLVAKDRNIYLGGTSYGISNQVIKLNSNGTVLWSKAYQSFLVNGTVAGILEKKNGNLYVVGYNGQLDTTVITLFEINPAGTLQWNSCYKILGVDQGGGRVVNAKLTDKDEIIVSAAYKVVGQTIAGLVLKADSQGFLKWSKKISYMSSSGTYLNDMDVDANNTIILSTYHYDSATVSWGLLRLSADSCKQINGGASSTIGFNTIRAFSPNRLVVSGYVAASQQGLIAQVDSSFAGLCEISPTTAIISSFPMPSLQFNLVATTVSIAVTPTVDAFYNASITRYEACTEIVGIGNVTKNLSGSLHLFPNPADAIVYIETEEVGELQIRNQLSQLVLQQHLELGKNTIDVSKLPKGIYYVSSIGSNGRKQHARLAVE